MQRFFGKACDKGKLTSKAARRGHDGGRAPAEEILQYYDNLNWRTDRLSPYSLRSRARR